jgi:hypothetical protein
MFKSHLERYLIFPLKNTTFIGVLKCQNDQKWFKESLKWFELVESELLSFSHTFSHKKLAWIFFTK